jgi:hypothetical protein
MAYTQLSRTRPLQDAWQDISDDQNEKQTNEIYGIIDQHGGKVITVAFSPSESALTSVIEYPDRESAQRSVAAIVALRTLEFVSIEELWDVGEWVGMLREAAAKR